MKAVFVVILLLLLLTFLLYKIVKFIIEYNALKRYGEKYDGCIVDYVQSELKEFNLILIPVLQFTVNGVERRNKTISTPLSMNFIFKLNDKVELFYNPTTEKCVIKSRLYIAILYLAIVFSIGGFLYSLLKLMG